MGDCRWLGGIILLLALCLTTPVRMLAWSPEPLDTQTVDVQSAHPNALLRVSVGHTVVLTSTVPLKRVYVGDPTVLHSFTSGQHEILITSKAPGISSLVLWDLAGSHHLFTVSSDLDTAPLRASLNEAVPGYTLQADASGAKILLSGNVPSAAAADTAFKLASSYSKDVVNNLQVEAPHGKQVELKLRIVEVDRTRLEQFGLNFFSNGNNLSGITTQQFGSTQYTPGTGGGGDAVTFDPLNLLFVSTSTKAGITVRDLEQKNVLQVLAEPTLTTMSGQQARFLSGGEFPFPVVQGGTGNGTAVTISFRPYGVKVDFTPTANPDGSIHLKVVPEVSTLDYSNAVTISGFTIPALSTRRAETEVEIRNGESFVVSGLLDHRTTEVMSKIPGIADVPILGQLFRSKSFEHSIVELVVVVTATVVDPLGKTPVVIEPKPVVNNMTSEDFDRMMKASTKHESPEPSQTEKEKP